MTLLISSSWKLLANLKSPILAASSCQLTHFGTRSRLGGHGCHKWLPGTLPTTKVSKRHKSAVASSRVYYDSHKATVGDSLESFQPGASYVRLAFLAVCALVTGTGCDVSTRCETEKEVDILIQQEKPSPELEKVIQEGFQQSYPTTNSTEESDPTTAANRSTLCRIGPPVAFTISSSSRDDYIAAIIVKPFWGGLHVKSLWTHPDHRGRGLARKLIQKAEEYGEYARQQSLAFLFVETFSFQALGFYQEKMGFGLEFTRKGYAEGASFHYLKMVLVDENGKDRY